MYGIWLSIILSFIVEYVSILGHLPTIIYSYFIESIQRNLLFCWVYIKKRSLIVWIFPVVLFLKLSSLDRKVQANLWLLNKLLSVEMDFLAFLIYINCKVSYFSSRKPCPFFVPLYTINYANNQSIVRIMQIVNVECGPIFLFFLIMYTSYICNCC